MNRLARGFKRLGGAMIVAIAVNLLLTIAAPILALSSELRYAVVPLALQLGMLFLLAAVMYARLQRGLWKIDRVRSNLANHRREFNSNRPSEVDNSTEFERIVLMQRRLIGAIETERQEAAERHGKLVEYVMDGRR